MNKKIFGIILVLVFISLPIKNASASINIQPVIIQPTSVALMVEPLSQDCYDFNLYHLVNSQSLDKGPVIKSENICRLGANEIKVTFSDLKPGNEYMVEVKELDYTYAQKFMTAFNDSDLNGTISLANTVLDQAIEGKNIGEYKVGSRALLSKAILHAEDINGNINIYTQSDIDIEVRDLRTALNTFELSKITSNNNSNSPVVSSQSNSSTADIERQGIVPRCNVGEIDDVTGQYKVPCDFTFFMTLINNVIKFLLFVIATPLIALIIMYTAYLYLTAGGNSGQVEKVKHILFNAVIGYIIALAAWLIINTIIGALNIDPSINTYLKKF